MARSIVVPSRRDQTAGRFSQSNEGRIAGVLVRYQIRVDSQMARRDAVLMPELSSG